MGQQITLAGCCKILQPEVYNQAAPYFCDFTVHSARLNTQGLSYDISDLDIIFPLIGNINIIITAKR
jgi:hypothetical protein